MTIFSRVWSSSSETLPPSWNRLAVCDPHFFVSDSLSEPIQHPLPGVGPVAMCLGESMRNFFKEGSGKDLGSKFMLAQLKMQIASKDFTVCCFHPHNDPFRS